MFAKSILASAAAIAIAASGAIAKPVNYWPSAELARRNNEISSVSSIPSFNNYLGLSSMSNFDDFFGNDNFASSLNVQTVVVQEQQVVCQTQAIEIVQQRLVILVEAMKRVLLTQICEVEVQTIVVQQASSIFSEFSNEIGHLSGRQAAFDSNIANLLGQIINSDGSLSNNNLGFTGSEVGNNSIVVSGNNWDDATSPESVQKAKDLAENASNSTSDSTSNSNSNSTSRS